MKNILYKLIYDAGAVCGFVYTLFTGKIIR